MRLCREYSDSFKVILRWFRVIRKIIAENINKTFVSLNFDISVKINLSIDKTRTLINRSVLNLQ